MPMPWRLLLHPPLAAANANAAWNMAVDEALLNALEAGAGIPTLRLYAWIPAAVSLGRFQPVSASPSPDDSSSRGAFSLAEAERLGLPVVRRPTGGRAVLHDQEVTYSVVLPHEGAGVVETYKAISEGLRLGLERLGIGSELGQTPAKVSANHADCFASATRSDLIAFSAGSGQQAADSSPDPRSPHPDQRKLVGSAQCRRGSVLLQHGSIPLAWNRPLYRELFGSEPEESGAGCLAALLRRVPDWEEVANAVAEGFRALWGPESERGDLTAGERESAHRLEAERYAAEEWTQNL